VLLFIGNFLCYLYLCYYLSNESSNDLPIDDKSSNILLRLGYCY